MVAVKRKRVHAQGLKYCTVPEQVLRDEDLWRKTVIAGLEDVFNNSAALDIFVLLFVPFTLIILDFLQTIIENLYDLLVVRTFNFIQIFTVSYI